MIVLKQGDNTFSDYNTLKQGKLDHYKIIEKKYYGKIFDDKGYLLKSIFQDLIEIKNNDDIFRDQTIYVISNIESIIVPDPKLMLDTSLIVGLLKILNEEHNHRIILVENNPNPFYKELFESISFESFKTILDLQTDIVNNGLQEMTRPDYDTLEDLNDMMAEFEN